MKEIEKMLKGKWYDANFDQELLVMRQKAELNCFDFNMSKPGSDGQLFALRKLLRNKLPKGLTVLAPVYFDYGKYTYFSEDVFINHGCYFMDGGSITIGKNTFVGPFCGFYTSNHPLNYADRNKGLEQALPIHIGDNCWIGANVTVLPGVTVGNGCVIAAGSVVTNDLADNAMAAGVPTVVKKYVDQ